MTTFFIAVLAALAAGAGSWLIASHRFKSAAEDSRAHAEQILAKTRVESDSLLTSARDQADKLRDAARAESDAARAQADKLRDTTRAESDAARQKTEASLAEMRTQQADVAARQAAVAAREETLAERTAAATKAAEESEKYRDEQKTKLEQVAQLTKDDAKQQLLEEVERDNRTLLERKVQEGDRLAEDAFDDRARQVVANGIQRLASEVSGELTGTLVPLPSDDIKGKIIGREGRNISAFEMATGVDVVVDDTPGAVIISGFDLVRREIAKRALQKLVKDGRMHPARIEDEVARQKKSLDKEIEKLGADAAAEVGVPGLPKEIHYLIGRLNFRTSYGQNNLQHSKEVARIGAMLATEIGADVALTKAACLCHDIGKALTHEIDGPHALISGDQLRKYGVSERIAHTAEAHHEDVPIDTIEAQLVQAADAISGARVGARSESKEQYIQRLKELENIANGFDGVEQAFAIQAGRELRIFVKPASVDDIGSLKISRQIADKIEGSMSYPGQIKVNVIRQTRAVEYAK